jgi:hypothetical protein
MVPSEALRIEIAEITGSRELDGSSRRRKARRRLPIDF